MGKKLFYTCVCFIGRKYFQYAVYREFIATYNIMCWSVDLGKCVLVNIYCFDIGTKSAQNVTNDNSHAQSSLISFSLHSSYLSLSLFISLTPLSFLPPSPQPHSSDDLEITQFFYKGWPDHGVPQYATSLLGFLRHIRRRHTYSDPRPLLVHCSAGVGRTGTFITLDVMLQKIREEKSVNVHEFVKELRRCRCQMVQTEVGGSGGGIEC